MSADLTPQGAAAVRLAATVVHLRAERDRARDVAVALEQRLARVEAQVRPLVARTHGKHQIGLSWPEMVSLRDELLTALEADNA